MEQPLEGKVIVIAHRGASGERPEHTLASYTLAIEQGADYIEPDLVLTKDGILVARHENEISETTDVADKAEFTDRKTTKTIDGEKMTGWFTEDFTLAELKTLRAKERLPQLRKANMAYDGQFEIPTFDEILALAKAQSAATGRAIGVYPETKHPSYFTAIGLPHAGPLLAALTKFGHVEKSAPVFIQSFEVDYLKALRPKTKLRLIQLMDEKGSPPDRSDLTYPQMASAQGLKIVATYADGIGPNKALIIPRTLLGNLGTPTTLVADAHKVGLAVHPWTFRRENYFLPLAQKSGIDPRGHGDLKAEIKAFLATGIDGIFSDNVTEAVAARSH
ncbi:MAG: glycerophosphodiester phosphodiesterase [Sphingorhabdus sp.]|uniref:glycerophosphodiester phosphodiesterase n=1 Tax=Sphingorhabdus sp. TaxID=1902408 RepID=UPI0025EB843B|nr:glycerophosphodiester phosphodiesterase [Sphingorhabdus sp.]MCO4090537.1 glycerophosphodiester phosphodiesterase [Sphingorhabdus sp.]